MNTIKSEIPTPAQPRTLRRQRRSRRAALPFSLRRAMFALPNLFTLASIYCGFYAIVTVSAEPSARALQSAALAVFFGIFFDMADGRVARATGTESAFGVQMDSLADVLTFGLAPAVIAYQWLLFPLGSLGLWLAFLYLAAGAVRLARFNVLATDSKPADIRYFVGLPIPLAAGITVALVMAGQQMPLLGWLQPAHVGILLATLALLMVSHIPYRTFKEVKPSKGALALGLAALVSFSLLALLTQPALALLLFSGSYAGLGPLSALYKRWLRAAPADLADSSR